MPALLIIAWLITAVVFVRTLYVEAMQTSWDLLESLIAANILGNVVAIPIALALAETTYSREIRLTEVLMTGLVATFIAAFMAGGAIWVFRRLKIIDETRRWPRIGYMLLGLMLFPSMVAFPFNLFFGWMIWLPLRSLHGDAQRTCLREAMLAERARRLLIESQTSVGATDARTSERHGDLRSTVPNPPPLQPVSRTE